MKMKLNFATNIIRYIASISLLLLAWEILIIISEAPPYVLPNPLTVFTTLFREFDWFAPHAVATLANVAIGGLIGIGCGILTGFLLAYFSRLRWLVEPYLIIFQCFPREALIPVIVVWLGFGSAPKIVNAAMLSFFPMALITLNSLLDVRPEYLELVRNWGANRFQEFIHCRLPNAIYAIAGGLKISAPLALIGGVLGEFMGGNVGLGQVIVSSGANFRMDRSFAAIVFLAATGILLLACIRFFQEIFLRQYKQE